MKKLLGMSLVSLILTACNDKPTEQASTTPVTSESDVVADIANTTTTKNPNWETVIVATQADFPPFSFKDEKGIIVGFERDLLEAIATASEFNVDFIDGSRNNIQQNLDGDSVGIWASSISITPEREQVMDFSEPYLNHERVVAILDNDANANIRDVSDLVGKTVAYSTFDSKGEEHVTEIVKDKSAIVPEKTAFLALKAVYSNKAIGALGNNRSFEYYTTHYPDLKIRLIPFERGVTNSGFAIKEGNTALKQKLDMGLEKVKANGTYDELFKKWFGNTQS